MIKSATTEAHFVAVVVDQRLRLFVVDLSFVIFLHLLPIFNSD